MQKSRRRRVAVAAGGAVVAAAVGAAIYVHAFPAPRGAAPPADASATEVARAYLTAKDGTWNWCRDPRMLSWRSLGKPTFVSAQHAGRDEECLDFTMTTTGSSDGSIVRGDEPWGLCLVKTAVGWRVYDQGQG